GEGGGGASGVEEATVAGRALLDDAKPCITMGNEMTSATSRVTSQNQISIPAEVRRRFRIAPGTELVWEERDGALFVRPKRFTIDDLRALCADRPVRRRSLAAIREARDSALRAKYGRG
ncbi:MAG: AbrB/MazE/SpoVT family DNA-binding domain-containing protein, partial [Polyangiaceae bacterium]